MRACRGPDHSPNFRGAFASLAVLLTFSLVAPSARATDCIDYRESLRWVGSLETRGRVSEVAIQEPYAFVTAQRAETGYLWIFDISEQAFPTLVGGIETRGIAEDVAMHGRFALVAAADAGLEIIDVDDPARPVSVAAIHTGHARFVEVDCNIAYVLGTDEYVDSLRVVDISSPTSPTVIATLGTLEEALEFDASDGLVFVSAYWSGWPYGTGVLDIIDVSNPSAPQLAHQLHFSKKPFNMVASGESVYVVSPGEGLRIIDVSTPSAPRFGDSLDFGGAGPVTIDGRTLYTTDGTTLWAIDVSGPPYVDRTVPVRSPQWVPTPVAALENRVFLGRDVYPDGAVDVYDTSSAAALPSLVGTFDVPGLALDVAVQGDHAFVAHSVEGLHVLDVSDPAQISVIGSSLQKFFGRSVEVAGELAVVTSAFDGVRLVDIADPSAPFVAATIAGAHYAFDLDVSGDYVYVADGDAGLQILSMTLRRQVGRTETPGQAVDVAVDGAYAFVADSHAGLQIVDVENPQYPLIVANYPALSESWAVTLHGSHALLLDRYKGLMVIDVTRPHDPVLIGSFDTPQPFYGGIVVDGDFAYVGREIADISDPSSPAFVGLAATRNFRTTDGDYVYALSGVSDSRVDIVTRHCDQVDPVTLTQFVASPVGDAIVISWQSGLEMDHLGFRLHRSERRAGPYSLLSPALMQGPSPFRFIDRMVSHGVTYYYKLEAISRRGESDFFGPITAMLPDPLAFDLGEGQPNPFIPGRESTRIRFEISSRTPVKLSIYDSLGRVVRRLVDDVRDPGVHFVLWDGRDVRGSTVASTVYYYRLEAGRLSMTRRLLVMK